MMDIPEKLDRVTRDGYLQPLAKTPTDSPTVAIEQPSLSFRRIPARQGVGWIFKSAKVTKIKIDEKTSSRSGGISEISGAEVNGNMLGWFKTLPVDPVAKAKVEEEKYVMRLVAKGVMRMAAIGRPVIEGAKFPPQNNQKGQQDGEYRKRKLLRDAELNPTSPPSGGHGYPSPKPYRSHRSTDTLLNCRLRSTHYTISQDHTSGLEALEDSLLASFAKRRRTDKPSISLGMSRLSHRSPNLSPSSTYGSAVVAENGGSSMQEITPPDLDYIIRFDSPDGWQPVGPNISEAAAIATTKPNDGKVKGVNLSFCRLPRTNAAAQRNHVH